MKVAILVFVIGVAAISHVEAAISHIEAAISHILLYLDDESGNSSVCDWPGCYISCRGCL